MSRENERTSVEKSHSKKILKRDLPGLAAIILVPLLSSGISTAAQLGKIQSFCEENKDLCNQDKDGDLYNAALTSFFLSLCLNTTITIGFSLLFLECAKYIKKRRSSGVYSDNPEEARPLFHDAQTQSCYQFFKPTRASLLDFSLDLGAILLANLFTIGLSILFLGKTICDTPSGNNSLLCHNNFPNIDNKNISKLLKLKDEVTSSQIQFAIPLIIGLSSVFLLCARTLSSYIKMNETHDTAEDSAVRAINSL